MLEEYVPPPLVIATQEGRDSSRPFSVSYTHLDVYKRQEQLRALEAGWRIAVALAPSVFPPGVDTAEDLARAERIFMQQHSRGARD